MSMNIFSEFLINNLLAIISLVTATLGTLIVAVWQIALHKTKYDQACQDINDLNKKFTFTSNQIASNSNKLETLIEMLSISIGSDKEMLKSQSPIGLGRKGAKFIEKSKFDQILTDHKKFFLEQLRQYSLETEADLDQACWKVMHELENEEINEQLLEASYDSGIQLPVAQKICAVFLRDEVKEELLPNKP